PYSTSAATRRDLPALREVLRGPLVSPSTRVRTATRRGGAATSVPPIQHSALRGDLDAVVGKAMAFDRTARYATVSELAADVDRALRKVPVSARPHTATYLMGSFVRRHRVLVAAVAVLMVGIAVTGVVMVRLSADRAEQRRIAEREAAAAETQRDIALRTAQLAERLRARSLLMAAATALDAGDAGTTLTNLDAIGEAHRGWEWRYLHLEADRSEVTFGAEPRASGVLPGTPGSARPSAAISTLAVAASAPRLAAGDAAGAVRVWRLDAPQTPVRTLTAHEVAVAGLALSPDGRLVATTDLARSVRVWEVDTGALLWEAAGVVSLGRAAFSPDGARLALGVFGDHAVSIRDAVRGQVLDRVPLVMPTAYRPTWVDDGGTGAGALLVTDLSRTQRVDVATHAVVWTRPLRLVEAAGSERFVARTLPNYVGWALCDAKTGDTVRPLGDETAVVDALDVSLDGAWTARAGATTLDLTEDGVVAPAEGLAEEGHPVRNQLLPGHEGAITAVVFASRTRPAGTAEALVGDPVFTGDSAGVVKGWSTATWPEPYVVPRSNDVIFAGAATSDGAVVVTGGWGAVKGWDAVLGMERWTRLVGRAYVSAVAPDPGGTRVAVGDWRGVLRVLDLADGAERLRVQLDVVRVVALAWAPDGRIVVGREDGRIDVVDARTGVVEQSVAAHRSAIRALALSPDGAFLASGSGDGAVWPVINEERPNEGADASVRLWRWPGLEAVVEMPGHGASVRSVAFAPDGARLVSGGSDRTLKMWSVPDGRLLATRVGVGHEVTAVAFTTDGSRLVTAHGEGPLLIWDATELELLATLPGGLGPMLWAGFSADGRTLTALGRSMALVRFETDRDAARGRARAEVRAARAAVDAMVGVRSADDLARLLEARTDLPAAVRGRAVAIARARGDHALMLNSAAWGRVLTPGQDAASLAEALAASTTAVGARPDDWMAWSTLALARYRVRDFAGALAAAERCMAIQREIGHAEDPLGDAVRVMILAGLGRVGEARTLLESTRLAMQREDMRLDHEAWSLFAEAEVAV
ncbi:MAG: hypothetical protein JNJ59_22300, partial [Deltaproteobacteria bacterium]|nr:hypothetical protein [Deltaproteobacteria bacterium]